MFSRHGKLLAVFILALANGISAQAALIPPSYMDCVVALGTSVSEIQNGILLPAVWHTTGSGFFIGHLVKDDPDPSKKQYRVYLVTAKHVIDGFKKLQSTNGLGSIRVRLNPESGSPAQGGEFTIDGLPNLPAWFDNPKGADISIAAVDLNKTRAIKYDSAFFTEEQAAKSSQLSDLGVSAGDGVYVLGFPMDIAGAQKNYVIVRQGVIARISEMLDHASDKFMIDALVFPGNSGGPVISRPELTSIQGTKQNNQSRLIGVVVQYVPYIDVATSGQTGRARVSFEENSGLANVVPIDTVFETINDFEAHYPVPSSPR